MQFRTEALVKYFGDVEALKGIDFEALACAPCSARPRLGRPPHPHPHDPAHPHRAGGRRLDGPTSVRDAEELRGSGYRFCGAERGGRRGPHRAREPRSSLGRLYHLPKKGARRRSEEVLERFQCNDGRPGPSGQDVLRGTPTASWPRAWSGCPCSLTAQPTTGLDPRSRNRRVGFRRELKDEGTTLLLTTQYLEEADVLSRTHRCDFDVFVRPGTSDDVRPDRRRGRRAARPGPRGPRSRVEALAGVGSGERPVSTKGRGAGPESRLGSAGFGRPLGDGSADWTTPEGSRRYRPHGPSSDDVFMSLTGHAAEQRADDEAVAERQETCRQAQAGRGMIGSRRRRRRRRHGPRPGGDGAHTSPPPWPLAPPAAFLLFAAAASSSARCSAACPVSDM